MKKFLLSIILAIVSTIPSLAEDVVLYFSPETTSKYISTYQSGTWQNKTDNMTWLIQHFWHTSSDMSGIQTGRNQMTGSSYIPGIKTNNAIPQQIKKISITFDAISAPTYKITVKTGRNSLPSQYGELVDNIELLDDQRTDLKNIITAGSGELIINIDHPEENLYYEVLVDHLKPSSSSSIKEGFVRISKIVFYGEENPTNPTLSWSADNATAVIGDDSFVKPELTCTTDDGSDVSDMIIYSSSDPTVASIDDKGELTILAEGSTTITASIEETDKIVGASASYILTVEEPDRPGDIVIRFNSETMPTPIDSYDRSWKAATGDYEFTVSNFSNGAGDWNYICCGGAESDTPPSVTTDFCIPDHLSQIIVSVDHIASDKGTITLLAYGETNLNHPVESISRELTAGKIAFDVTPQPGLKYRISVDGYDLDPEGAVRISKIVYRKASDIIDAESATLLVSEPYNHSRFFEVNTNTHTSSNSWLAFKFIIPDGHTLWHRFVKGSEIIAPGYDYVTVNASALSSADESDISDSNADTDRHGFNLYADAPFSHVDNGSLEFYTESAEGVRSNIRSVQFTGVTSINDIPADENDVPAEYYNLQGIRIDTPITPGVYIIRRGSSAIKAVLR